MTEIAGQHTPYLGADCNRGKNNRLETSLTKRLQIDLNTLFIFVMDYG